MAATHQSTVTPPAPPTGDPSVIKPRSEETPALETGDPAEQASAEVKERMAKTNAFWNRMSPPKEGEKPARPAEAQPEKPPKKEDKPVAAKPAAGEPEEKPDKKPKTRKREPEVDPIQIAEATGTAIAREIAKANKPAPQPAAEEPEQEFPEEFKADIPVFEEMARLNPKRYGSIKKEIAKYTAAETDYIAKWEAEHEGQDYDPDSEEHNAFYAKIRPNYDPTDFNAAKESLIEQKVEKRVMAQIQSREAEAEKRREAAAEIKPEVDRNMIGTLGEMIRAVDPDNAELAKDWESIKTLEEKNPILYDAMTTVHNIAKPIITTAMRLFRKVENPDPQNQTHMHIFNTIWRAEAEISRLPIKDRYDEQGRLFATQEDYTKMSPAEQERHWHINEPETVALLRGEAIAHTKTIYEKKKQEIERYTRRPNGAQSSSSHAPEKKPEPQPQQRSDNGSPSVSGRGTLPGDGQSGSSKGQSGKDSFFSRYLGA